MSYNGVMKYAMYAIMALLTVMVGILTYMTANKSPTAGIDLNHEVKHTQREILFNVTPIPDGDDIYVPNIFDENEDEEEIDPDITKLDQMMYATSAVNLRGGPGTDFERIGSLSANQEVHVIGQHNESKWYKIEYLDITAFVSSGFLAMSDSDPIDDTPLDVHEPNPEDFGD